MDWRTEMTATADLWQRRSLFDDDHEEFRASVREFLARRVRNLAVQDALADEAGPGADR
jgi:hypothetical protein